MKLFRAVLIALTALASSACATVDPYTGVAYYDPGATAALVGGLALAGAVAYSIAEDRHHRRNNRHRRSYRHHRRGYYRDDYHRPYYDGGPRYRRHPPPYRGGYYGRRYRH